MPDLHGSNTNKIRTVPGRSSFRLGILDPVIVLRVGDPDLDHLLPMHQSPARLEYGSTRPAGRSSQAPHRRRTPPIDGHSPSIASTKSAPLERCRQLGGGIEPTRRGPSRTTCTTNPDVDQQPRATSTVAAWRHLRARGHPVIATEAPDQSLTGAVMSRTFNAIPQSPSQVTHQSTAYPAVHNGRCLTREPPVGIEPTTCSLRVPSTPCTRSSIRHFRTHSSVHEAPTRDDDIPPG